MLAPLVGRWLRAGVQDVHVHRLEPVLPEQGEDCRALGTA